MNYVTCSTCGGSGKERRGVLVSGIDWSYDFSQGFASRCCSQEQKDAERDRCVAWLKTLKPGDRVMSSGQFERKIVDIGMYDGWPFWRPTPAISYVGPLKSIEYDFYYNLSPAFSRVGR